MIVNHHSSVTDSFALNTCCSSLEIHVGRQTLTAAVHLRSTSQVSADHLGKWLHVPVCFLSLPAAFSNFFDSQCLLLGTGIFLSSNSTQQLGIPAPPSQISTRSSSKSSTTSSFTIRSLFSFAAMSTANLQFLDKPGVAQSDYFPVEDFIVQRSTWRVLCSKTISSSIDTRSSRF